MARTIRDCVFEELRRNGMTTVFGNPGSNELPFLKDFPADFTYVLGLHEGAVISMAEGYALVSGQPAFVNLHAAAGTGNAMGGLTNAVHSHAPLVITAGQQVRSTVGMEVMLANTEAATLPKPLVKWSAEPLCAEDVPRTIAQAIHLATLPAPGPVYVSVPYDDWEREAPGSAAYLAQRSTSAAGALTGDRLEELRQIVSAAERPVLVVGPEVDAAAANARVAELATRLGAPAWIAPSPPRCPFPTLHAAFRGVLPAGIAEISERLAGHDLVLVVGAPVFRYHQFVPGDYLPAGARLLHFTSDPGEAARAPMGEAVVGDVAAIVDQLLAVLPAGPARPLEAAPARAGARGTDTEDRLAPHTIFEVLDGIAPSDTIYVSESTSTADAFWQSMDLGLPGSYFNPAAGGLGFGLPATVGAQLAAPGRQVVGIIGDGSANYGITALWTAARHQVPVVFLILSNGTYGALRGFAEVLGTGETPGLDLPSIDFVSIARGYGVPAERVTTKPQLIDQLTRALDTQGPMLLEVASVFEPPAR